MAPNGSTDMPADSEEKDHKAVSAAHVPAKNVCCYVCVAKRMFFNCFVIKTYYFVCM